MVLPMPLAPMAEDRRQVLSILDALDHTDEPETRAELAGELVHFCARYQDAEARAVYPVLHAIAHEPADVDDAEHDQRAIREAMSQMRKRLRHVKPINVHANDPEGFEALLEQLVGSVRAYLLREDRRLFPLVEDLDDRAQQRLLVEVERAVAHASSHPDPPHNPIGRFVANVDETIERVVHDASTPWHPGLKYLKDHKDHQAGL